MLKQEITASTGNSLGSIEAGPLGTVTSSTASITAKQYTNLVGQKANKATEAIGEKLFSTATYKSVFGGVDIEYTVTPNGLKESVVISAYSPLTSGYAYKVDARGMTLELQEDNSILAYAKEDNTVIYTISAPFLEDAEGDLSTDIETMLLPISGDTYMLAYMLPMDWMQTATYPVVLDPTVYANSGNLTIEDIAVAETNSDLDTFGYNVMYLRAGKDSYYGRMRSFIKFTDLPPLKAADVVTEAKFTLYTPIADSTSMVINVHEV